MNGTMKGAQGTMPMKGTMGTQQPLLPSQEKRVKKEGVILDDKMGQSHVGKKKQNVYQV